jgi:hypothetical protein
MISMLRRFRGFLFSIIRGPRTLEKYTYERQIASVGKGLLIMHQWFTRGSAAKNSLLNSTIRLQEIHKSKKKKKLSS